jgi:hypothetical protein
MWAERMQGYELDLYKIDREPARDTPAMKQSFADLRNAFTKALVQAQFVFARPICLETDAPGFAIAGIRLSKMCARDDCLVVGFFRQTKRSFAIVGTGLMTYYDFLFNLCYFPSMYSFVEKPLGN